MMTVEEHQGKLVGPGNGIGDETMLPIPCCRLCQAGSADDYCPPGYEPDAEILVAACQMLSKQAYSWR